MFNNTTRKVLLFFALIAMVMVPSVFAGRTTESKTFKVKQGGDLIVDVDNAGADIQVRVWDKSEVLIKVDGIREEELEDLEIEQSGNTIRVEFYGDDDWGRSRHMKFILNVPSEFNLDLATSGGDITIDDKIIGRVEARTSGGDVEIDNVDGEVSLRTSGGDVSARNIKGNATMQTAGGDIDVGDVQGELSAQTAGGDIEMGTVRGDVNARTAGGDIIAHDVGGDVSATTAGGDVRIGNATGEASLKTAGGDIELRGGHGEIVAKTAGGDLELEGLVGSVDGATAGGDIVVELEPEGNRGSSLETKGGDISFYVPSNAKVTIEAEIRIRGRYDDDDDYYDDYEILSDFDVTTEDNSSKRRFVRIELNGGGPRITLDTMNGNIEVRKLN